MNCQIEIRQAEKSDAEAFSRLAFRSKAYWGYSSEFMQAAKAELTVSAEDIESKSNYYYSAIFGKDITGFYVLERLTNEIFELGAMFVEPDSIGKGVGKAMMNHAKARATSLGATSITIQSDPNAKAFYISSGGVVTGESPSESIPGRYLPTLEISL